MEILYEDRCLIVAIKPVGALAEAPALTGDKSRPPEENMPALLAAHFATRGERAEAFPVHRLDREVGGVTVYAKDAKTAGKLSACAAELKFAKEYLAVIGGCPPEKSGEWHDLLYHDTGKNKTYVVGRERRGVREAALRYEVLGEAVCPLPVKDGEDSIALPCSLARVRLLTGRTHQIRVQFSSRGYSLLGDSRYGGKRYGDGVETRGMALWSVHLSFLHPRTGKPMMFEKNPPDALPWSLFPLLRRMTEVENAPIASETSRTEEKKNG